MPKKSAWSTSAVLTAIDPIRGSTDWTVTESTFTMPEGTGEAVLRLRRRQSQRIDSRIRGKLWLDSVRIGPVKP